MKNSLCENSLNFITRYDTRTLPLYTDSTITNPQISNYRHRKKAEQSLKSGNWHLILLLKLLYIKK